MDNVNAGAIRSAVEAAKTVFGEGLVLSAANIPDGFTLSGPSTAAAPRDGTLIFLAKPDAVAMDRLSGLKGALLILPIGAQSEAGELAGKGGNVVLRARNPKYAYALIASELYPLKRWKGDLCHAVAPSALAAEDVFIGEGVVIEPFVTIGRGSRIGARTILFHGVSIGPSVEIGEDCLVRENSVVGDLGFGFAFDPLLPPKLMPHVGGVRLGDRVEIGSQCTVSAGTIEATRVDDDTKLSDHVHIAHNVHVGRACVFSCNVSVSGSSVIGAGAWLGPGSVVRNKIRVGDGVTVGMGAIVVGDVEDNCTVAGLPAKPLAKHTDPRK
jgi:UDP-3-O-[3-hydroxymyristoyl] glucosamine N-acyltransferase LpxD